MSEFKTLARTKVCTKPTWYTQVHSATGRRYQRTEVRARLIFGGGFALETVADARAAFYQYGVPSQSPSKSRYLISKILELDVYLDPCRGTDLCRGPSSHIGRRKTEKYPTLLSRQIGGSPINEN